MGDGAESILEGESCQGCGQYLGDAVGYTRYGSCCEPRNKRFTKSKQKNKKISTGDAAIKGVLNFIVNNGLHEDDLDLVCVGYCRPLMGEDTTREQRCEYIQKDFGSFVKWFRLNYKK